MTKNELMEPQAIKPYDFIYFESEKSKFIYLLHHTNFEDGMRTELHNFFDKLFEENNTVFIYWLNYLFSNHKNDINIVEGILRLISTITIEKFQNLLFPIVRYGFENKDVCVQEAVITVAEEWRSQECLKCLENYMSNSKWLKDYADELIIELKEELNNKQL